MIQTVSLALTGIVPMTRAMRRRNRYPEAMSVFTSI